MIINKEVIEKLKPCEDRFNNFLKHYPNFNGSLEEFVELENITYDDKVWVFTKLFTREQNVRWALKCAESVIHNFNNIYPDDKRPELALEAVRKYLNNPSEETAAAAKHAAESARSAARSAKYAARSAEAAARSAAESVAWSTEYAARSAAEYAAWSVAESVEEADYDARPAAELEQEELNLKFAVEVVTNG